MSQHFPKKHSQTYGLTFCFLLNALLKQKFKCKIRVFLYTAGVPLSAIPKQNLKDNALITGFEDSEREHAVFVMETVR